MFSKTTQSLNSSKYTLPFSTAFLMLFCLGVRLASPVFASMKVILSTLFSLISPSKAIKSMGSARNRQSLG
jgi:hypothetical protein